MIHGEEFELGRIYDHRLVRKLWPYLRPYRGALWVIGATAAVFVVSAIARPWILGKVIASEWHADGDAGVIRAGIVTFACMFVAGALADFYCVYLSDSTTQHVAADLRAALYRRFGRLPLSFFDRVPNGVVLSRLVNDPNALEDLLETGFVTMIRNGIMVLAMAGAMLYLNWRLALVAFAVVPVVVLVAAFYRPLMRKVFRRVRVLVSRLNARMEENFAGHSTVLLLNQEARCAAELDEANDALRRARVRASLLHAFFPPILQGAFGVGLALVIWYGGRQLLGVPAGPDRFALIGELVAFTLYVDRFGWPLQMMMERVQLLQAAMASLERIFGFLEQEGEDLTAPRTPAEPREAAPAERSRGELAFEDVWFAYRGDDWVLKGLSFHVAPGERIAIAGPTGAGKTTILSLASALYRPQKGRILLDGRDLAELDPRWVRRQVATVLQDVFIFADTVRENVRLWEDAITDEDVRLACGRAHAANFVERLPEGYARKLGGRGAGLSVGQRQLVSFARALAYDPPILILDEATSSVDAQTEEAIRQGLDALTADRTSLVVAHRFSTLAGADRLLVIKGGRIAEETTPAEFLRARRGGAAP